MRHLCFLLTATTCCQSATGPSWLASAERIVPPTSYRTTWESVEFCAGLTRDFNAIDWYVAGRATPDSAWKLPNDATGEYYEPNRIVIARWWALYDKTLNVIRHEALHALLHGDPTHADPRWQRCDPITQASDPR